MVSDSEDPLFINKKVIHNDPPKKSLPVVDDLQKVKLFRTRSLEELKKKKKIIIDDTSSPPKAESQKEDKDDNNEKDDLKGSTELFHQDEKNDKEEIEYDDFPNEIIYDEYIKLIDIL